MSERVRDPDGMRQRLLEAGKALLARRPLAQVSVNDIVAAAGVAKGSFFHHFKDRNGFLVRLHRQFHDALLAEMKPLMQSERPGLPRLWRGTLVYLGFCARQHAARVLLFEARSDPAIWVQIRRRNRHFMRSIEADLNAARAPEPTISARLWITAVVEVALLEAEAARALPGARRTLARVLKGLCATARPSGLNHV